MKKKKKSLKRGAKKQRKIKTKKAHVSSKKSEPKKTHILREKIKKPGGIQQPPLKKEVDEDKYIETDVDRLYHLVKRDGFVKVADASKKFKVSKDKIEEWGNILEEHDLIKLHYPSIGEPILILKKFKPEFKIKGRKKHNKKAIILNLTIIIIFILFVLIQTKRLDVHLIYSEIQKTQNQYLLFLLLLLVLIIIVFLVFRRVRKWGRK